MFFVIHFLIDHSFTSDHRKYFSSSCVTASVAHAKKPMEQQGFFAARSYSDFIKTFPVLLVNEQLRSLIFYKTKNAPKNKFFERPIQPMLSNGMFDFAVSHYYSTIRHYANTSRCMDCMVFRILPIWSATDNCGFLICSFSKSDNSFFNPSI